MEETLFRGEDQQGGNTMENMVQWISKHPGAPITAKVVAKMHTTGMRLISVLEFQVACQVAVIENLMQSVNANITYQDTVSNPKSKSAKMKQLV